MRYIGNKTNLLNNINQVIKENCTGNERVNCERMYLTPDNAKRIDYIRNTIEEWNKKINK